MRLRMYFIILLVGMLALLGMMIIGWQTAVSAKPPKTTEGGAPNFTLQSYETGFSAPVGIAHAGDNRLFVVEQSGRIRIIDESGTTLAAPFLDLSSVVNGGSEEGLLGLAFHPDYPETPYFYVNYTEDDVPNVPGIVGYTVIERFSVDASDPNLADPASGFEILRIGQPDTNHNGGDIHFGPDGYLYIGMGDGGSGNDPWGTMGNGQNPETLLGAMLRIDVDGVVGTSPDCGTVSSGNPPYTIPSDNPFVADNDSKCNEIWGTGLRNPWRFSFDSQTGDLYIGDVGQSGANAREEVNYQPASSNGGENYGWRCYEGFNEKILTGCGDISDYYFPFDDYPRTNGANPNDAGTTVVGGYVYRGTQYPSLQGYYFYADFGASRFWLATSPGSWQITPVGGVSGVSNPAAFGEGCDGELYVASYFGTIYHIQGEDSSPLTAFGGEQIYLPYIAGGEEEPTPSPTATAVPTNTPMPTATATPLPPSCN